MYSFVAKTIFMTGVTGTVMIAFASGPLCVGLVVTPKIVACLAAQAVVMSALMATRMTN